MTIKFSHKRFGAVQVDILHMAAQDSLEFIVSNPTYEAHTNTANMVVSGALQVAFDTFSAVANAGENANFRPRKDLTPYTGELTATLTALEDTVYVCSKCDNTTASYVPVVIPAEGSINVPAGTLVVPTAPCTVNDAPLQPGEVLVTDASATIVGAPNAIIGTIYFV